MKLLSKIRTFLRLPLFEQMWLIPSFITLGICVLALKTIPFRRLASCLGVQGGSSQKMPSVGPRHERIARGLSRAIRLAARWTPWESKCLAQALTGRLLLGLHGVPCAVYFGLARGERRADLEAHAWVNAGDVRVTGGGGWDRFKPVECFVSAAPARR
ncbi:MAG: lasso peptide biosynthesis B2 protein [Elusimicrobia bacterium]|nr:lasso peptide biosynthesis B2 protein [Elusimicrobiota bacterium]MDE2237354.1 lasso peptide biosynthesis B2 protein [Elusimicrobiota bacterium]MDE2425298.1 lasso peptide biosynthesis B2 protein [Elusimicrobiota bacterium]